MRVVGQPLTGVRNQVSLEVKTNLWERKGKESRFVRVIDRRDRRGEGPLAGAAGGPYLLKPLYFGQLSLARPLARPPVWQNFRAG